MYILFYFIYWEKNLKLYFCLYVRFFYLLYISIALLLEWWIAVLYHLDPCHQCWFRSICVSVYAFVLFYRKLKPTLLQPLLRNLTVDVPKLSENTEMPLKVLIIILSFDWFKKDSIFCFPNFVTLLSTASDWSLWAELEILLHAWWAWWYWLRLGGGASAQQEAVLACF